MGLYANVIVRVPRGRVFDRYDVEAEEVDIESGVALYSVGLPLVFGADFVAISTLEKAYVSVQHALEEVDAAMPGAPGRHLRSRRRHHHRGVGLRAV